MKALVVGGTGPSGPFLVNGLLARGYHVTVLHSGLHEVPFTADVTHIHTDPHFVETLEPALAGMTYDVAVISYGRLRLISDILAGKAARMIAFGGANYAAPADVRWGPLAPVSWPEGSPMQDDPNTPLKFQYKSWLAEGHFFATARAAGADATLLRFPRMYGPRAPAERLWSLVRRLLDGRRQLVVADGGLRIESTIYAENVAEAALLAVDHPEQATGQVFNARDDTLYTDARRALWVAQVMGVEAEIVSMPYALVSSMMPIGGDTHFVLDTTKIRRELGYADAVDAAEGIRRSVEWLLAHRPEPGGELETQLNDPFDYDAETQVMQLYAEAARQAADVDLPPLHARHMYRHPKKPNEDPAP